MSNFILSSSKESLVLHSSNITPFFVFFSQHLIFARTKKQLGEYSYLKCLNLLPKIPDWLIHIIWLTKTYQNWANLCKIKQFFFYSFIFIQQGFFFFCSLLWPNFFHVSISSVAKYITIDFTKHLLLLFFTLQMSEIHLPNTLRKINVFSDILFFK